jgi:hypothetical protein
LNHFCKQMKYILGIILCLIAAGCASETRNGIVGVWQTDTIESEWGPNIITLRISEDDSVTQENRFIDENESIQAVGTYEIVEGSLICRFSDDHGGEFTVESRIEELTRDRLVLRMEDEIYEFKRK